MGVTAMVRTKVSVMVATTMIRATRFLLHPHRRQHQRPRPPLRLPLLPPLGMVAAETAMAMVTSRSAPLHLLLRQPLRLPLLLPLRLPLLPPLRLPLLPPLGMVAAETATAMATSQSVRPRLRPLRPWLRYLRHHPQLVFQECRIVFRLAPLPMRMMTRGAMLQWNALL